MKIEPIFGDKDGYRFKIDDIIVLEIADSAISTLRLILPPLGYIEEYYKSIKEQFDIGGMINDLLNKYNKINRVIIDSEVCRVDNEIIFQTSDLEKYKK